MIPTPARSWLFTPGDRPDRFATARDSGAGAYEKSIALSPE